MAAGADLSRPFTVLEGGYNREDMAEDENLENARQLANGKPPRHLSVMRHSVSSARFLAASDFVSQILVLELTEFEIYDHSFTAKSFP